MAVEATSADLRAPLLQLEDLSRSFGGVFAVNGVSLSVADGEFQGIIGPNGAGKSTLFHLIAGHLAPDRGQIVYAGQRIDGLSAHQRAPLGVAIVFQGARLFRNMSVLENVMVGSHARSRYSVMTACLRLPRFRAVERTIRQNAVAALARVGLTGWEDRPAELLPLGQQRALQVARALCAEPRLLLLDEPASGLRGAERRDLGELLGELKVEGLTMMLVEHDVAFVTRLADRVTVLDLGEVIAEGRPEEVVRDPRVRAAYIGKERQDA